MTISLVEQKRGIFASRDGVILGAIRERDGWELHLRCPESRNCAPVVALGAVTREQAIRALLTLAPEWRRLR